jgi:Ran GTPase-activating protein 1
MFTSRLKEEIPKTLLLLFNALQACSARLVELDLSDNAIGPMGVPGIENWLSSVDACELKILRLNNCGMGIAGKVSTVAEGGL